MLSAIAWISNSEQKNSDCKNVFLQFDSSFITSVFRSSDYLSTLLRIAQTSKKPPSFFSWSEPAGGLSAWPTQSWPKNGFCVFGWICFESYPSESADIPM